MEFITISWCHKLKTGVLTTNRHVISIIIDMYLLQCSCKVNYKINNNNQHMNKELQENNHQDIEPKKTTTTTTKAKISASSPQIF